MRHEAVDTCSGTTMMFAVLPNASNLQSILLGHVLKLVREQLRSPRVLKIKVNGASMFKQKLHRPRPGEGDLHQTKSRVSMAFVENLFKSALLKMCFLQS